MDLFTARCGCGAIYRPLRSQKACTSCQARHAQAARAQLGTDRPDTHHFNKRIPYQRPYTVDEIRQGPLARPSDLTRKGNPKTEYTFDQVTVSLGGKKFEGFQDGETITIEPIQETYKPKHLQPAQGTFEKARKALQEPQFQHDYMNPYRAQHEKNQAIQGLLGRLNLYLRSAYYHMPRSQNGLNEVRARVLEWLEAELPVYVRPKVVLRYDHGGPVTLAISLDTGLGEPEVGVLTFS